MTSTTGMHTPDPVEDPFARSKTLFNVLVEQLAAPATDQLMHADCELMVSTGGREIMRQLHQDQMDLRAAREQRLEDVTDTHGIQRRSIETGHRRQLATVVGEITVSRLAYRQRGETNLYVADSQLNLPTRKHSHGLERLAVQEAIRGSYDEAGPAIERATGVKLAKRQIEELVAAAAVDFETFYETRQPPTGCDTDTLVISVDGKGVVMRTGDLRTATAAAAAKATTKLATRLSKGEKPNRKRMATVGAVYDLTPTPRSPADIIPTQTEQEKPRTPGPKALNKWLSATLADPATTAIAKLFDEAERRDPYHRRHWIALVDGNNHQIDRLHAEATTRSINLTILVDFVHVLEYLWNAAWCFHPEGDPAAETWVQDKARAILHGHAATTAAAIRRTATLRQLPHAERAKADTCADYLLAKQPYLDYPTALTNGWSIATGVIEGACRYLVKDRMDRTGARWGLHGAEAILKLRAINTNGDLDNYWTHHLTQEQHRNHTSRYTNHHIPHAA